MARLALSLMPEPQWARAMLPLFTAGEIDALEHSVDVAWSAPLPAWAASLVDHFSSAGALYGHGVHLSVLSAEWTPRQSQWIERLRAEVASRDYVHVSEHFGWSTAGPFSRGAPLPLPRTAEALRIGRDRLARLAEACGRPVGLENLALSMSGRDAEALPDFLDALLVPSGGFVVLDLHNLYCQAVNFDLDPLALMRRYPRERVRELHVAGGRWSDAAGRRFRRDTHDDAIPVPVIELLAAALERFEIEVVVVERLGASLRDPADEARFAEEVRAVRTLASAHATPPPRAAPRPEPAAPEPARDAQLAEAQAAWLLELGGERGDRARDLGVLAPWLAGADASALETARALARQWLVRPQR